MRPLTAIAAGVLVLTLTACGTSATDTGIHGIEVPADVTNVESTSDLYEADLPGWEHSDAVTWMEEHLPLDETVDGMDYFRSLDGEDITEWSWRGETAGGDCHSLFVSVENTDPVSVAVVNEDNDDFTCTF